MFYRFFVLGSLLGGSLLAKNPVSNMILEKAVFEEQIAIDTLGIKTHKLIPVKFVQHGATMIYINRLTNKARIEKNNIVVLNPIPFKTSYLRGSATCEGSCEIRFSIDGGNSFDFGENLYVLYGKKRRVAMGSEYTHIQFTFTRIKAFSKTRMAFKAKVK
jgi:uncharacterized repeat protein (TIGR01451 family)